MEYLDNHIAYHISELVRDFMKGLVQIYDTRYDYLGTPYADRIRLSVAHLEHSKTCKICSNPNNVCDMWRPSLVKLGRADPANEPVRNTTSTNRE